MAYSPPTTQPRRRPATALPTASTDALNGAPLDWSNGTAPLQQPGGFNPMPFTGGDALPTSGLPGPAWQPPAQIGGGSVTGASMPPWQPPEPIRQPSPGFGGGPVTDGSVTGLPGPGWQPPQQVRQGPPSPPSFQARLNAFGLENRDEAQDDPRAFLQSLPGPVQQHIRDLMGRGVPFQEAYRMTFGG